MYSPSGKFLYIYDLIYDYNDSKDINKCIYLTCNIPRAIWAVYYYSLIWYNPVSSISPSLYRCENWSPEKLTNCPRFPGSEWWGRDSNSGSPAPWEKDFCFATTGPAFCTVRALWQPITTVCWMNSTAGVGVCACERKGGSHGESELLILPYTASSNTHMLPYILRPLSRILDSPGQLFRRYS